MLKPSTKISAIVAALVIGIFSIYATQITFTSTNATSNQQNVVLNMQSGAQIQVALAPGQTLPTQINNDAVAGITIDGVYVPAGANASLQSQNIQINWQMAGTSAIGINIQPYEQMPDPDELS